MPPSEALERVCDVLTVSSGLTNCRRKSSLLVMNFRVRIVHDFSAILTEAPGSGCESGGEGGPGEAAAGIVYLDSRRGTSMIPKCMHLQEIQGKRIMLKSNINI